MDKNLDCLIEWSAGLRSNIQNKGLVNNDVSGDFSTFDDFDIQNVQNKRYKMKYMRATNAFEMALEICAFARFLNELNKGYDHIQ